MLPESNADLKVLIERVQDAMCVSVISQEGEEEDETPYMFCYIDNREEHSLRMFL
jgi:hypothetical protein